MSNHYDVLGLTHTATDDEVKKSFKKLAIKYHPDKSSDPRHHELFIKINDAYETLKDPETRKKYDTESGFVNYSRPSGTPSYSLQFAPGSSRSYYTQTTYTRGTGGASYTFTSSTSGAPSYSSYFDLHQRYTARGSDEREKSMREEAERIRRQQEAKAREELEQRMRREEEIQRMKQQAEELRRERSERERQQHEQAAYESAKRDAYRRAWSYDANNDDDDDDASGPNQGSSTNPIVLSDAEEGSDIEITAEKIYPEVEEPEENELEEEESAEEINIQGNVTPDEVEERDDEKYYGETYEYETDGDTTRGIRLKMWKMMMKKMTH